MTAANDRQATDANASYQRWRDLYRPNESETHWVIAAFLAEHLDEFIAWIEANTPTHAVQCVDWLSEQQTAMRDAQRLVALAPLMGAGASAKLRTEDQRLSAMRDAVLVGASQSHQPGLCR